MERLLADATKLTGVKYDINNLADVYDAIHVIQTELDITGTTAKESAETFSGSLASMKGAFANVMGNLTLGTDLTPHLQALAQTTATFLFGNFLPMIGNLVKALPGAVVTFIQEATPLFIEAGRNMIIQLRDGFVTELPTFWETTKTMISSTMEYITANLPTFLDKGKEILMNIANGVLQAIPVLITEAGNVINSFVTFLMDNLPVILKAGKDLLLALVDGIIEKLPSIAESAIKAVSNFIDVIIKNYPEYLKTGWGIITELVGGIIARLPAIISTAGELIAKFIGMLISKLPDILSVGGKILLSIVSGIGSVASDLYNKAAEIMQRLWDKIGEWKDKFFNAGKNIVGSIADGIRSAISTVTSAIGDVVSSVRDYLPFSPAKEGPLRDLNKLDFTIIADGIYAAKNPVMQAMDELTRSTVGGITADMVIAGQYSLSKLGGTGQPTTINDGGVHLHIANLNNSNDRDIHDVARVLEFYRRQTDTGKGVLV